MSQEKDSSVVWFIKYILPVIIVLAAITSAIVAVLSLDKAEKKEAITILPKVEIFVAESVPLTVEAKSQGTVESRTETMLIAEVSGRIQSISNSFFAGGYFKKGDPLIEIDPIDYRGNLATAKSRYAEAKLAYEQEKALSEQAIEDWNELGKGEGSDLALRKPQLEMTKARLESANVGVEMAQRDLDRTIVRAPYDGRIREKFVDVGQMVSARQSQLTRIYSTDTAEIRLPIALNDIQYLDLPEAYSNTAQAISKPKVSISARFGNETFTWDGVIDRTEGAIDSRTRLSYVVAQIDSPYEKKNGSNRPPLKVGLFIDAKIEGKRLPAAIKIPRQALRQDNTVYIVDKENRLRFKTVDVYKTDTEWAIITDGLEDGDRICLTALEYAVMGMQLEIEPESIDPKSFDKE
jgi:RND family efflux transporter MFP subunit